MVHFDRNSSLDRAFLLQLDQLSPTLRRNLGRIQKITNLERPIIHFEEGQIIAVSDASVSDDGFASHSYT